MSLMPIVKINTLDSWTTEELNSISQAVHDVLVEILHIPANDFNHRILNFDRKTWHLPPGKSDKYIMIELYLFPGRRSETKANLFKALVARLRSFNIPVEDILIIILEPTMDNWGIRGGSQASQLNMDYKLDI